MEKDFRLFVKNLPINIDEAKVQDLFGQHVTVKKIDLKEKKDLDNKLQKFAFVNVTTTDKQLYNCFGALNGERIDGFEISVEVAKESFLDRLKREREENQLKKESINLTSSQEYVKPNLSDSFNAASKAKHKKFSDLDFTPDINFKDKKLKRTKTEDGESSTQESPEQNDTQKNTQKNAEQSETSFESVSPNEIKLNKVGTLKRKIKFESYNDEEERDIKNYLDIKKNNNDVKKNNLNNAEKISQKISEKPEISESERKRQLSLKQKKKAFKTQEHLIRNALRSVDNNTFNKKILFDDDIEMENSDCKKARLEDDINNKKALFNSDDEDGDEEKIEWNENELEAKSKINQKLMKLQSKIGYDERFVLDERFIEGDSEEENKEGEEQPQNKEDINSVTDEKKWQLEILKDVLGDTGSTPKTDSKDTVKKQSKMIRYDPTASNHQEFEVTVEKSKKEKRIKKKIEQVERVEEPIPKVSKEIFFEVEKLAIGNQTGGFSLLKTNKDDSEVNGDTHENENNGGFKFNFNTDNTEDNKSKNSKKDKNSIFDMGNRNAFKCNSSDDEDNNKETKNDTSYKFGLNLQEDNTVFFIANDARFEEAVKFFKTETVQEEDDFKNKRRGLKQIVRSKIRNNMKKKIPWNKKKIRKVQKRN